MSTSPLQQSARAHYSANEIRLRRLTETVAFILKKVSDDAGVKVHHVSARTKDLKSYLDKFDRKTGLRDIESVTDLVGGRIVTLFRSDIEILRQRLDSVFTIGTTDDKIADTSDERFGYMSVHFICRLRPELSGPHYDDLHDIDFEIQLRTILMDAWANVSHYIDYKGESSIPAELRRDFYALSALFYVADSSFEQFYSESRKSKQAAVTQLQAPRPSDIPLNADTLGAALLRWFPDRGRTNDSEVSTLMEEISSLTKFSTIEELDQLVEDFLPAAEKYEADFPPSWIPEDGGSEEDDDHRFFNAGILRAILAIGSPEYASHRNKALQKRYDQYR